LIESQRWRRYTLREIVSWDSTSWEWLRSSH